MSTQDIIQTLRTTQRTHLHKVSPRVTKTLARNLARRLPSEFNTDGTQSFYLAGIAIGDREKDTYGLRVVGIVPYLGQGIINETMVPTFDFEVHESYYEYRFAVNVKHADVFQRVDHGPEKKVPYRYTYKRRTLAQIEGVFYRLLMQMVEYGQQLVKEEGQKSEAQRQVDQETVQMNKDVHKVVDTIKAHQERYYDMSVTPSVRKDRYRTQVKGKVNQRFKEYLDNASFNQTIATQAVTYYLEQHIGSFGGHLTHYNFTDGSFVYEAYND